MAQVQPDILYTCAHTRVVAFSFLVIIKRLQHDPLLTFLDLEVNLEDITLTEIKQVQKDKYCTISLICGILKGELLEAERRTVVFSTGSGEWRDFVQRAPNFNHAQWIIFGDLMHSKVSTNVLST